MGLGCLDGREFASIWVVDGETRWVHLDSCSTMLTGGGELCTALGTVCARAQYVFSPGHVFIQDSETYSTLSANGLDFGLTST